MVRTRGMTKSRRRAYRRRVKRSKCRKKGPAACRGTKGCKYASGKKRRFCRKAKSRKLSRNSMSRARTRRRRRR